MVWTDDLQPFDLRKYKYLYMCTETIHNYQIFRYYIVKLQLLTVSNSSASQTGDINKKFQNQSTHQLDTTPKLHWYRGGD